MATKASSNGHVRTFGPLSDLEDHLRPDWWRLIFNSTYLKTDGDVVENDVNTAREVDMLVRATGLRPTDHVLDLCCGQGRHCLELARRGFGRLIGLDRSEYLIRLARRRAAHDGLLVDFHEGDARCPRLPDASVDCVAVLGNSFGYFERQEEDVAVLQSIKRVLRPGGTVALDLVDGCWMRRNFEARSWEWIDRNSFVCRERTLAADGTRIISREIVVRADRGVVADQFYGERLYSRARIEKLLADVGFRAIRVHGRLTPDSDRNQDLGMMAQRLFVTARSSATRGRNGSSPARGLLERSAARIRVSDWLAAGTPDPHNGEGLRHVRTNGSRTPVNGKSVRAGRR